MPPFFIEENARTERPQTSISGPSTTAKSRCSVAGMTIKSHANLSASVLVLVALFIAMSGAASAAPDPSRGEKARGPNVVHFVYEKFHDPSDSHHVSANAYRTDRLTFNASYEGKRARAGSRYRRSITTHGFGLRREARHPWVSVNDRKLVRLVHESLFESGTARVRVRAHRDGVVDEVRVRLDLSECDQSPPTYPITCVVEL
jgi:hypothetical protein